MSVSVAGMLTVVRLPHPANAAFPSVDREAGKESSLSVLHPWNACAPMEAKWAGSFRVSRLPHS